MSLGSRINVLKKERNISLDELCQRSGVPKGTLSKITSGVTPNPTLETVKAIARALDCSLDDLDDIPKKTKTAPSVSDEALKLARDYETLDGHGQRVVRVVADAELERVSSLRETPAPVSEKIIPLFGARFAAGLAEPDFQVPFEDYSVPAGSRAEFAIRIHGDSMEPHLHDGEIALCLKSNPEIGETGVFLLDGEFLVKQFCTDGLGNVYLLSLNRSRSDCDVTIWHDSGRDLRCAGKVMLKKLPLP